MANFVLRRTDAARLLAQTQMGWFRPLVSRTEGISATDAAALACGTWGRSARDPSLECCGIAGASPGEN